MLVGFFNLVKIYKLFFTRSYSVLRRKSDLKNDNIYALKIAFCQCDLQYLHPSSLFIAVIKKGRGIRPDETLATLLSEKVLHSTLHQR